MNSEIALRKPRLLALLLIGLLLSTSALAAKGRLVKEVLHSPALEDNLLGDSPDRAINVYLPPGYDEHPDQRYPVLYLLHGMDGNEDVFTAGLYYDISINVMADTLIAQGKMKPMIIAMPNADNKYNGSFYANSSLTGNWEFFAVQELVQHMDSTYRTLPQVGSRGIAGHSMGGYGAMQLALRYPDVYCAVDAMSGLPSLEELLFGAHSAASSIAPAILAMRAAFSPNLSSPLLMDSPFTWVNGKPQPVEGVWQKWLVHDSLTLLGTYWSNPVQLRAIHLDCGTEDQFMLIYSNRAFSQALTAAGIPHTFEEYPGNHTRGVKNQMETKVLPFFSEALAFAMESDAAQMVQIPAETGVLPRYPQAGQPFILTVRPPAAQGRQSLTGVLVETTAMEGEARLSLRDDGREGDAQAGDGVYSIRLQAPRSGRFHLPVQLTFGQRRAWTYTQVRVFPPLARTGAESIFDDGLAAPWQFTGVRATQVSSAEQVHQGTMAAGVDIERFVDKFGTPRPAQATFTREAAAYVGDVNSLKFWFHPGEANLTEGKVTIGLGPTKNESVDLKEVGVDLGRREWQEVTVPIHRLFLSELGFAFTGEGRYYLDGIRLVRPVFWAAEVRAASANAKQGGQVHLALQAVGPEGERPTSVTANFAAAASTPGELRESEAGRYEGDLAVPPNLPTGEHEVEVSVRDANGEENKERVTVSVWPAHNLPVYVDGLGAGWGSKVKWVELKEAGEPARGGQAQEVVVTKRFGNFTYQYEAYPLQAFGYRYLEGWFHPGEGEFQEVTAKVGSLAVPLSAQLDLRSKSWQRFELALPSKDAVIIQFQADGAGSFFLDDLVLVADEPPQEEMTAVLDQEAMLPQSFRLEPNFPNPFNPETTIPYFLPEAGRARLRVYNPLGQTVRTLVDGFEVAGAHAVVWDGLDDQGRGLASGVYLYRLQAGERMETRKLLLLR